MNWYKEAKKTVASNENFLPGLSPQDTSIDRNFALTFGKYKGEKIDDVVSKSPSYIYWAASNIAWFKEELKKTRPDIYEALLKTYRAKQDEEDAWAYTGGRMPDFDLIFWRIFRR